MNMIRKIKSSIRKQIWRLFRPCWKVKIYGLSTAQRIAIEQLFFTWTMLGKVGASRWTAFFADGDGNFHPDIRCGELFYKQCRQSDLLSSNEHKTMWHELDDKEIYCVDFDQIAWKLYKTKEQTTLNSL
jgi:hypothetical protein